MPRARPRLEAAGVSVRRGARLVVQDVSFGLESGQCLGVAGPNASGKSTLLGGLAGSLPLASGQVSFEGRPVRFGSVPPEVGFATQEVAFYAHLSGRDNLRLFGTLYDLDGQQLDVRVEELLQRLQLTPWADKPASTYSGGLARRLHLALSMIHNPTLLLFDEPTVGLDPQSRRILLQALQDELELGTSVVLTSQILGDLEIVATHVMVIRDGRPLVLEPTRSLMERLGSGMIVIELAQKRPVELDLKGVPHLTSWTLREGVLRARVTQPHEALAPILARLDRSGILAARIEVLPPTLDQVLTELLPR